MVVVVNWRGHFWFCTGQLDRSVDKIWWQLAVQLRHVFCGTPCFRRICTRLSVPFHNSCQLQQQRGHENEIRRLESGRVDGNCCEYRWKRVYRRNRIPLHSAALVVRFPSKRQFV